MTTRITKEKTSFDAVTFMRKQRNRISKDISNMDFKEIKEYFSKRRTTKRSVANKV